MTRMRLLDRTIGGPWPLVLVLVLLLGLILLPAGCSDPPNVGGACTATAGCDPSLTCDVAITGGYCTKACATQGSTSECPEGSVCDEFGGNALSCAQVCRVQTDCRPELECNGTTGSSVKICKVKV
jgi:hypothetical protein